MQAGASLLMGAGFETTVNLIGNAVAALSAHPDQFALAQDEPDRWPECSRRDAALDPPVQTTARRRSTMSRSRACRLQGPRRLVMLSLAGANRDPAVFADPTASSRTGSNAKEHVAFSSGLHACLGASLARMEAELRAASVLRRGTRTCDCVANRQRREPVHAARIRTDAGRPRPGGANLGARRPGGCVPSGLSPVACERVTCSCASGSGSSGDRPGRNRHGVRPIRRRRASPGTATP